MSKTFVKSKLDKSKDFNFLLLRNIACISLIFEVLNFDKFNEVIAEKSSNICLEFVTAEVSNLDISYVVNDVHLTNMAAIVLTLVVIKLDKSNDSNL